MPLLHAHAIVSGLVQGVFYRATTREKARDLQLGGWVRNLPDGCVEVVAEGEQNAVHQLLDWLWEGPPGAQIDNVDVESETIDSIRFSDFTISY